MVGRGSFGKNEAKKAAAKHVKVFVERLQNNRVFPGRMAAWFEIASGRKSVVKGANAEPLGGGVFKITKPHVDNYRADGTLDTVIDASQCEFDSNHSHDVWSDKDLVKFYERFRGKRF